MDTTLHFGDSPTFGVAEVESSDPIRRNGCILDITLESRNAVVSFVTTASGDLLSILDLSNVRGQFSSPAASFVLRIVISLMRDRR